MPDNNAQLRDPAELPPSEVLKFAHLNGMPVLPDLESWRSKSAEFRNPAWLSVLDIDQALDSYHTNRAQMMNAWRSLLGHFPVSTRLTMTNPARIHELQTQINEHVREGDATLRALEEHVASWKSELRPEMQQNSSVLYMDPQMAAAGQGMEQFVKEHNRVSSKASRAMTKVLEKYPEMPDFDALLGFFGPGLI